MSLSSQVGRFIEKYLLDRVVAGGYSLRNYRVEYEQISENSIQVILTVSRGILGFFSSGRTLVNDILQNEEAFKSGMLTLFKQKLPQYNFYLSDILTISNQKAVFTISYYPRTELPPDMIRKILSYLPPDEIERLSRILPGQRNAMEDQYLWHMMVMNNFSKYYPFLHEVPLGSVIWKQLYQELDALRRGGISMNFDNEMFKFAVTNDLMELVMIMLKDPLINPNDNTGSVPGKSTLPIILAVRGNKLAMAGLLLGDPRVYSKVDPATLVSIIVNNGLSHMAGVVLRTLGPNVAALILAIYTGNQEIFEKLIREVDPSGNDNAPICVAALTGRTEIVRRLLQDPRVNPSAQENVSLLTAVQGGHSDIVRMLLQDPRVDPSARGNTALLIAIEKDNSEMVRLLLQDPRVDPAAQGNSPVLLAAIRHNAEVLRLLLRDPRVDPLVQFPAILSLALKTSNESEQTPENLARSKEIFTILLSDPRIKQAIQGLSFVERAAFSVLGTVSGV